MRSFWRVCRGAAPDHHGHPPWVKMELLAPPYCVVRRFERGDEGVSAPEVEGFRGRDHSFHGREKQGVGWYCRESVEVNKKETVR